jgi:hypothetical protein
MPTIAQFNAAAMKLVAAGYHFYFSLMSDDARKPGVTNFGRFFVRVDGATLDTFWLNYKTINEVDAVCVCRS